MEFLQLMKYALGVAVYSSTSLLNTSFLFMVNFWKLLDESYSGENL